MAEPVLVDVDTESEAIDLSRALAVRGLAARPTTVAGHPEVELLCRREERRQLLADLLPALEAWRLDRGHGPLRVVVGEGVHTLGDPPSGHEPPLHPAQAAA